MPHSRRPRRPIGVTLGDSMGHHRCRRRSRAPSRHPWWPVNGPAETAEGGFTGIPREVLVEATIFAWPWSLDMDSSAFPSSVQILAHRWGLQYHVRKALPAGSPDLGLQWKRHRGLSGGKRSIAYFIFYSIFYVRSIPLKLKQNPKQKCEKKKKTGLKMGKQHFHCQRQLVGHT